MDDLVGKLLVAMPGMGDPRFDKSVIVMCAHNAEHAMGLVVNKPKQELTLGEVLEHLGIEPTGEMGPRGVMDGGPVRPDRGYVLHSEDFTSTEGVQRIAPGLCLTATRDVLEAVGGEAPPERFMLALGCSGWGPGQLEDELKRNAWLVVDLDEAIVFGDGHEGKWERAISALGFDPSQLMGEAGRA